MPVDVRNEVIDQKVGGAGGGAPEARDAGIGAGVEGVRVGVGVGGGGKEEGAGVEETADVD